MKTIFNIVKNDLNLTLVLTIANGQLSVQSTSLARALHDQKSVQISSIDSGMRDPISVVAFMAPESNDLTPVIKYFLANPESMAEVKIANQENHVRAIRKIREFTNCDLECAAKFQQEYVNVES